MNNRTFVQQCVYCGAGGTLTRDHVPPKTIFPKLWPLGLITVPAYLKCNQDNSKDDEYFRLPLSVRRGLSDHPAIQQSQSKVIRSLLDPNSPEIRQSFINTLASMHGGNIRAESAGRNQGTTFILRFPILRESNDAIMP
jgi:hypothetical protein